MDSRDRFYGFSLLFKFSAEKKTYYAGIILDAPSIVYYAQNYGGIMYLTLAPGMRQFVPYSKNQIKLKISSVLPQTMCFSR